MTPPAAMAEDPRAHLLATANGFMRSKCLHAAVQLGVADALAGGPLSAAALAAKLGAKPDHLRRALRYLVHHCGIFQETEPGVFANNGVSELLRADAPGGMRDMVGHFVDESYMAFSKLPDALLASHPGVAFTAWSGGPDYWSWLQQPENQEASSRFNRAMKQFSSQGVPAILAKYDWSQHANSTVADIGGNTGNVLAALLRQHPGMKGIVFDRPDVIEEARAAWAAGGPHADLAGRVELAGGDFFVEVPKADVYFMKSILHDWDDEQSIKILKTIRAACAPGAHLLLCGIAMPDDQPPSLQHSNIDLEMMVMYDGKERTVGEWRGLLEASGFALERVVLLPAGHSIVVGRPA